MNVRVLKSDDFSFEAEESCLAVPVFNEGTGELSELLRPEDAVVVERIILKKAITGKAGEVYFIPTPRGPYHGVLTLGLGKRGALTPETVRRAAGNACAQFKTNQVSHVILDASLEPGVPVEAFAEGLILGQYAFKTYKSKDLDTPPETTIQDVVVLVAPEQLRNGVAARCERRVAACNNANWARDLAQMPANDLTPAALAERAKDMAKDVGCTCEVFDEQKLSQLGMNALLGVAKGSSQRARLICLEYTHPRAERTIALVGKGVTFDAGGISIKPSESMHEMKYDMCGAAAVLGAMKTLCELKAAVNVVCVVPAVENLPSGDAQKPGDIVRAYSGKTIEINNTDAEGRLILADALAYAVERYKPDVAVDLATLTGACIVALGHHAAALIANEDALAARLAAAADAVGERVWLLPLWEDYEELIEGTDADLCNIGPAKEAGTIVGGAFLKPFAGDTPWAHLDIAGTAWGVKNVPYLNPKIATGYGVRLLTEWVLEQEV